MEHGRFFIIMSIETDKKIRWCHYYIIKLEKCFEIIGHTKQQIQDDLINWWHVTNAHMEAITYGAQLIKLLQFI